METKRTLEEVRKIFENDLPKGKKLIAKAVCVKDGKTTACYRVDVTDELGNLTATVTTTGYHIG